jgi:two-component system CheB/CheR fusion protein
LEVKIKEETHQVEIEAIPLLTSNDQQLFLILFEEVTQHLISRNNSTNVRDQRIKELEAEIAALREDMHSILEEQEAGNEELQSANEEILSSNEELQSINEELETSKEEIESTNEELLTINQELQVRNDQLSEAYGYSEAILDMMCEATLILDKDLRVKSANKAFYRIFGVTELHTEGRMLYELDNRQWDMPEFPRMLEDVIRRDVLIKAFEVQLSFTGIGEKVMLLHARKVVQHQRQEAKSAALTEGTAGMV